MSDDEFALVPLEDDSEIFEEPGLGDITQVARWAPDALDKGVIISDQFKAIGEALKKRGQEMVKAGQSRINWNKNFWEAVKGQMNLDGYTELLGIDWRICVQKTKPRLVIEDESAVPDSYKRTRTVVEIDKEALRQDLEVGVPVAGARLESDGSLRIRPNTKKGAA
jgi:hypothetical protein